MRITLLRAGITAASAVSVFSLVGCTEDHHLKSWSDWHMSDHVNTSLEPEERSAEVSAWQAAGMHLLFTPDN